MHCRLMGLLRGACFAGLAGCATSTAVAPGSEQESAPEQSVGGHCPDPLSDCAQNNGTGVYTDEAGFAGIGPTQLMITRFINNSEKGKPPFVTFQGRYFDATNNEWVGMLTEPGTIASATYHGKPVQVLSVDEQHTSPIWALVNGENQAMHLIGDHIVGLALTIAFTVTHPATVSYRYVLEFHGAGVIEGDRNAHTVHGFDLRWREPDAGTTTEYCSFSDANHTLRPDPVVFQRGMAVDPVRGTVTRNADTSHMVTLSCGKGALATAYRWGYEYRAPAVTDYFDAAIPMKRASYCADARFFTVGGTAIQIADDQHIIDEAPIQYVEAWWAASGALCVDTDHLRHPELAGDFDFTCKDVALPSCPPPTPPTGPYIVEGPVQLAPVQPGP